MRVLLPNMASRPPHTCHTENGSTGCPWRRHDERFAEPMLSRGLELAERMRAVAERRDASVGEVAIAWTLRHPAVHGAIVGFRRAEQADGVVQGATLTLSEDDISALECA